MGGNVQQRRQHDEEDDVRIDLHAGDTRDQPQDETADGEEDRIRDDEAPRDGDERRDRYQQAQHQPSRVHAPQPSSRRFGRGGKVVLIPLEGKMPMVETSDVNPPYLYPDY